MENLETQVLDISKIKIIPSDTEIPVHNNDIQTKRALCSNFPENSVILDNTEQIVKVITDIQDDLEQSEENCIENIPTYIEDLQAVFNPLNVEECQPDLFENGEYTVIDNVKELQRLLSELLMRFDTSPKNYTKEDYLYLLTVLYKSLLFIYKKETKRLSIGDNLKKVAYCNDHFLELKNQVATEEIVLENQSTTLPSIEYLNKYYILRWEEF